MSLNFWKAAVERAVKTFAQALLALLGTGSVGVTHLDWGQYLSVAGTAALASVLTSVASLSTVGGVAPTLPAQPVLDTAPGVSFASTQARIDAIPDAPVVVTPVYESTPPV